MPRTLRTARPPSSRSGEAFTSPRAEYTGDVVMSAARPLLAVAERAGMARASLLQVLGATEETLRDPERRTSAEHYIRLWEHVARTLSDPGLPVRVAEAVRVEDYHLPGFAVMTSANGREMLAQLQRYSRLHASSDRWRIEETADEIALHFSQVGGCLGLGYRLVKECLFAKLTAICRAIGSPEFVPRWIHFRHAAPADVRPLRRFLGISPGFSMAEDALAFDRSFLSRAPVTANAAFNHHFVGEAERRLVGFGARAVADLVRQELVFPLDSGAPAMANLARRLGMTERTLRRRLELEGTNFRQLVDEVRRSSAPGLLANGRGVGEVALLLGFNGISAFGRAFRRWYGMSPRAARCPRGR
jgi:AraC-like DNA-binding protein